MATALAGGESPLAMHRKRLAEAERCAAELRTKLPRAFGREFDERLALVRRYLPWREDGKAALMLGYDLLRDLALEAGRRLGIGDDVFLLTFHELQEALDTRTAPAAVLQERRRRRAAEKRVSVPLYLGSEEIENIGHPPKTHSGRSLTATPISTGTASGAVRIVHSPRETGDLPRGYVLVCPSTDPSWTPLFVDAAALVLECGGMLSHGAVVAREMGIPAVVLPQATQILDDGETITVDGQHGAVVREDAEEAEAQPAADPSDVRIAPENMPPVPGPIDRRAAALRSTLLLLWGVYLAAVFLLPRPWCYKASMELLDAVLWPLVPALGKPGAVAAMAVGLALLTMVGQRLLTDNRRLLAAKQRANGLRREAAQLPTESPRRVALARAAAGVQPRLLGASFVPLAVLLGPMVMSFVWLPDRVDPVSWNPPPGAVAHVTAEVDGEYSGDIRFDDDAALVLDEQTPAVQSTPPIRAVLTRLLARWQGQADVPEGSQRDVSPAMIADLQAYLDADGGLPPRQLAWTIQTPETPGRYTIALAADNASPVRTSLVVGDRFPPQPKEDLGDGRGPLQVVEVDGNSPVRHVVVTYQFTREFGDRKFFVPLAGVASQTLDGWGWAQWDAGWLLTYIVVYLLTLLPVRWLLRIP